jgi:hypothetical protein
MLEDRITPSVSVAVTDTADDGTANSLRAAITQFNNDTTDTGTYTIQLAAGTYHISIPNTANDHDVSNSQGDLNINPGNPHLALVIQGATDASGKPASSITVDADVTGNALDRVFEIGQPGGTGGITVEFENLSIENGFAQDDGGAGTVAGQSVARGGGILDYGGNVTLSNVTVQHNKAWAGVGTDYWAEGGGIYALNGLLTIDNSVIQSNGTRGAVGTSAHPDGEAGYGGGIEYYSENPPTSALLTITNSTVANNSATGGPSSNSGNGNGGNGDGGGIGVTDNGSGTGASVTITACTISNNTAVGNSGHGTGAAGKGQGGGFYFAANVTYLQLVNSTIAGNKTISSLGSNQESDGGGIYFSEGIAILTNDTVADNTTLKSGIGSTSGGIGGGIDNASPAGSSSLIQLTNTLVALNNAAIAPDYNGTVNVSAHNLIGKSDGSGFNTGSGNQLGSIADPLDPHLGPLQDNGGPIQTMALLPGSPAIDAGNNTFASGANGSPLTTDQRGQGFARVVNGTVDLGAFEVQPPPPPGGGGGGGSSSSPAPPPTLHTPPLLAFFDALLHGVETINGNGTETVVDSIFGIPLFISLYDAAGNLTRVTLFGIDVTLLIELSS